MTCLRVRRGKYVVDYRDGWGRRRAPTFPLTPEGERRAKIFEASVLAQEGKRSARPAYDPDISLNDYATVWLDKLQKLKGRAESTRRGYRTNFNRHILPLLGPFRLRDLSRARLKLWLADVAEKLSRGTLTLLLAQMSSLLESALEDGLIDVHPMRGLARSLNLSRKRRREDEIHALTAEQLVRFRETALRLVPRSYLAMMLYSYTGIRLGEGLGLQLGDIDLDGRQLAIRRQVLWNSGGKIGPPKTARSRRNVDLSDELHALLSDEIRRRREEDLRLHRQPWLLFPSWPATPGKLAQPAAQLLQRTVGRIARAAGLPEDMTLHWLRHTYASLLLQRGESIQYVSDQLGHDSIKTTCDLYGRWLPIRPSAGGPNLLSAPLPLIRRDEGQQT